VNDAAACSEIDELVEAVPVFASELADGPVGGGGGERKQQQPGDDADRDELSFGNVVEHGLHAEIGIERDPGEHVDGSVEEGEEAEETPEFDEPAKLGDELAEWSDGQREDEQEQGVVAGGELDFGSRVGAEGVGDGLISEQEHGAEAGEPGEGLEQNQGRAFHWGPGDGGVGGAQ